MGTVHYQYWHSKMVPVTVMALYFGSVPVWHGPLPVLVFKNGDRTGTGICHFGSVPVWAQSIAGTGIQ
jgi:hypothetical protein